jgi:hypothetical protein
VHDFLPEAAKAHRLESGQAAEQRGTPGARRQRGYPAPLLPNDRARVGHVDASMRNLPATRRDPSVNRAGRHIAQRLAPADHAVLPRQHLLEPAPVPLIAHAEHPRAARPSLAVPVDNRRVRAGHQKQSRTPEAEPDTRGRAGHQRQTRTTRGRADTRGRAGRRRLEGAGVGQDAFMVLVEAEVLDPPVAG